MNEHEQPRKAVVFLAYSADALKRTSPVNRETVRAFSRNWQQLELFTPTTPDAVVFISPDEDDPLRLLRKLQVKHIVDIRDVPYLTFSRLDRKQFFVGLQEIHVDYLGMHELMHEHGADSFPVLLHEAEDSTVKSSERVEDVLMARIKSGPTAVFCDSDPKYDAKVHVLLDFLANRRIRHAPVLAVDAN